MVLVPAGLWMTGPIKLKSNVNLHLKKGSTFLFTTDKSQYALVEGVYEGRRAARNQSPISGTNLENIAQEPAYREPMAGKGSIGGGTERRW